MFYKKVNIKMLIESSRLIYDNNIPFKVYTLKSEDDKFYFKSIPEPTKLYLGIYRDEGTVGKYTNFSDFDGHLLPSYVDCMVTYNILTKRILSAKIDNIEVYKVRQK